MTANATTYQPQQSRLSSHGKPNVVQTKMKVNTPGDTYEQEADAMADKVMREKQKQGSGGGLIAKSLRSKTPGRHDKEEPAIMRKASGAGGGMQVPVAMAQKLNDARLQGSALPDSTRQFMERSFNRDFSGVRVHEDQDAGRMNDMISSRAFTQENHIFFNSGQYTPETEGGLNLLAHELTHVVQQGYAPSLISHDRPAESAQEAFFAPGLTISPSLEHLSTQEGPDSTGHPDSADGQLPGMVMRKESVPTPSAPGNGFIAGLTAAKGGGHSMPVTTRVFMEQQFAADFSAVRIHDDANAGMLSDSIGAQAFTYGNDIFFSSGCFVPETPEGTRLLAHELTHTLQHTGMIQRANRKAEDVVPKPVPPPDPRFENKLGVINMIDPAHPEMHLKTVPYSEEKLKVISRKTNFVLQKEERPGNQRAIWIAEREKVKGDLNKAIIKTGKDASVTENGITYYYFQLKGKGSKKQIFVAGDANTISDSIITPTWNNDGVDSRFDVDHIMEWQISGPNDISNLWLWEASANRSAGSKLKNVLDKQIADLIAAAVDADKVWTVPKNRGKSRFKTDTTKKARDQFLIIVDKLVPGLAVQGSPKDHYSREEIFVSAKGFSGLIPMTERDILKGTKYKLAVMIGNRTSRGIRKVSNDQSEPIEGWFEGFDLLNIQGYDPGAKAGETYATLLGEYLPRQRKEKMIKKLVLGVPIIKMPGVPFLGKVERGFSQYLLDTIEFPRFSPIQTDQAYINDAEQVVLSGIILPSIPFLKDLKLEVIYIGNDLRIQTKFTSTNLQGRIPKPFNITSGELTIFASLSKGFGVIGDLNFEIEKVGSGTVSGHVSTDGGFGLLGAFNFEPGLFDESSITAGYEKSAGQPDGEFFMEGTAKKTGKGSKIFKNASLNVSYRNGVLKAGGEAELLVGIVDKGKIEVIVDKGAVSVVADFLFNNKVPAIKSGSLHFAFNKASDGTYDIDTLIDIFTKFDAIPQVQLHGNYKSDGTFLFEGDANIVSSRFSGTVHFGLTNQEVDKEGKLTGKRGKDVVPFGHGDVDFRLTDWLHGKIGALLTPDGKTVLNGALVPDPHLPLLTIMKEPIDKKFAEFSLPRFTLFGIPHIAEIFVEVGGNLYFKASIGPLFLNNASLSFRNLEVAAPEKAIVEGEGELDIPASAEFGLQAHVKAGGGILVVQASVLLEGSIGLAVTANAGLHFAFSWSTATGLVGKDATAYIKAALELVARLSGDLNVDLDLLLTTINLYHKHLGDLEKRWPIGSPFQASFSLLFDRETGNFQMPTADQVQHDKPEIGQDTVKKAAMEEPPPPPEKAPGREKAIAKVLILEADATTGEIWGAFFEERYNYIRNLERKYPDLDWKYLNDLARQLDARDFDNLSKRLTDPGSFPASKLGKYLRLEMLDDFLEERKYVDRAQAAELRIKINELPVTGGDDLFS